jgi:L-lysine exporter family protein LysE/ArgO
LLEACLAGFSLGLSLILAIGAQNAFVLRQGLRGEHVAAVCATCAVSDAVLIGLGVTGFRSVIAAAPWLRPAMVWAGAAFLIWYGLRSLRAAFASEEAALVPSATATVGLRQTLTVCLALTWLNPHVYLDTVLLIGSVSTRFSGHEAAFTVGASTASVAFFFALGFGAAILRPLFEKPAAWRVLDGAIALTMWAIAANLLLNEV